METKKKKESKEAQKSWKWTSDVTDRILMGNSLALATTPSSLMTTAILEAGRRSLDNKGNWFEIVYENESPEAEPVAIKASK